MVACWADEGAVFIGLHWMGQLFSSVVGNGLFHPVVGLWFSNEQFGSFPFGLDEAPPSGL